MEVIQLMLFGTYRADTRALIGRCEYSYLRVLPDIRNQLLLGLISKEFRRAGREDMDSPPPPPINALVSA